MKKNSIIITINNKEDISKLKELGITKIAYPLRDFCVGIPNTFLLAEITEDAYLFINRVLDNKGIDDLKKILSNLPNNIKGIIFDDLGILEIIKDLNVEKILYLSHFNTNSESINIYLEYVDVVIVSTDITKDEIISITNNCDKDKLCLFVYGYVGVMYSRRLLIDNYSKFYNIEYKNPLVIENTNHKFMVYENNYGTYYYHNNIFNGLELLDIPVKYYFINSAFLSIDDIKNALNGNINNNSDQGFLYTETIYKLKEDSND